MIGAVIGDMVGSIYEFNNIKSTDFPFWNRKCSVTDDSVMSVAVAKWLLEDSEHTPEYLVKCMVELGRKYPRAGYGGHFRMWLMFDNPQPYNSWGNGSGMRVSPVGFYAGSLEEAERLAEVSAAVSHNHPEGIKGAQAISASIFLARSGKSKEEIREYVSERFGYNLDRKIVDIRKGYRFDVSCQGSVPEAIIAFLDSDDYESAIRLAVSIGGDSDTIACMTGAIAEAYYGVPDGIVEEAKKRIPGDLLDIINRFRTEFMSAEKES